MPGGSGYRKQHLSAWPQEGCMIISVREERLREFEMYTGRMKRRCGFLCALCQSSPMLIQCLLLCLCTEKISRFHSAKHRRSSNRTNCACGEQIFTQSVNFIKGVNGYLFNQKLIYIQSILNYHKLSVVCFECKALLSLPSASGCLESMGLGRPPPSRC